MEATNSQPCCAEERHSEDSPETTIQDESSIDEVPERSSWFKKACCCVWQFYLKYDFPIMILIAIALARAYPPLGAVYLEPQITASWIATVLIFLFAGLALKSEELAKAFQRLFFNCYVEAFNFGFVSAVVFGFTRLLITTRVLEEALADGMVICSCLPIAINAVIVLTASMGGDEAIAVFHSTFGNLVGIFLSPALILGYLGKSGALSFGDIILKLTLRVLIPLIIGHALQKFIKVVREFFNQHRRKFKKAQEYCLIYIVYTVFCRNFYGGVTAPLGDVFLTVLFQFLLMLLFMTLAWFSLRFLFRDEPELRCTGTLICYSKTIALGIPLINSMYEGDPNEALYSLPILIWHPMQLVLGSILVPRFKNFIQKERERLKALEVDSDQSEIAPDAEEGQLGLDEESDHVHSS